MFAFAVWDRAERRLWLVRDRLGIKPLYWGRFGSLLLFGSELKALRAHSGWQAELNRDAIAGYLRFGYIPSPHSIYRGVQKLPPGCLLHIEQHRDPRLDRYWSLERVIQDAQTSPFRGSDAEAEQALFELLSDAVSRRMIADVPLGAFLSGGIDSSTVVALMQSASSRKVRTFTIGFREGSYDEAPHAKAVAEHLGTDHTELYVTPEEAQDVIPHLPDIYDEPFADSSQIPTFLVSQLTRKHVTVALSGDGGDELFCGYTRYLHAASLRPVVAHDASATAEHRVSSVAERPSPRLGYRLSRGAPAVAYIAPRDQDEKICCDLARRRGRDLSTASFALARPMRSNHWRQRT
jgi:asparagine synthase (glutamine-hydrolysing)